MLCVSMGVCSIVSHSLRPQGLAYQAPLSMEFSRQEYYRGLPFPTPRDSWPKSCISGVSCIGRWIPYHWHYLGSPLLYPNANYSFFMFKYDGPSFCTSILLELISYWENIQSSYLWMSQNVSNITQNQLKWLNLKHAYHPKL